MSTGTAGDARRRRRPPASSASSMSPRSPRASRSLSLYGASKARSEELVAGSRPRLGDRPPAGRLWPGDHETLELFKMAKRGADPAAAEGPAVADPRRRSCAAAARAGRKRTRRTRKCSSPTTAARAAGPIASSPALGRAVGRRSGVPGHAPPAAPPRRRARPAGPPRQGQADPRPRRLFLPPRLGRQPVRGAPARDVWRPEIATEQGLAQTALWYRSEGWL